MNALTFGAPILLTRHMTFAEARTMPIMEEMARHVTHAPHITCASASRPDPSYFFFLLRSFFSFSLSSTLLYLAPCLSPFFVLSPVSPLLSSFSFSRSRYINSCFRPVLIVSSACPLLVLYLPTACPPPVLCLSSACPLPVSRVQFTDVCIL